MRVCFSLLVTIITAASFPGLSKEQSQGWAWDWMGQIYKIFSQSRSASWTMPQNVSRSHGIFKSRKRPQIFVPKVPAVFRDNRPSLRKVACFWNPLNDQNVVTNVPKKKIRLWLCINLKLNISANLKVILKIEDFLVS